MKLRATTIASLAMPAALLGLAGCGSGGDAAVDTPPDVQARVVAATDTASGNALCTRIAPFYWEIGDASAARASGQVGGTAYGPNTRIGIASASKWFYSTYWVQRTNGALSDSDIRFFNFQSGYTYFSEPPGCTGEPSVDACLAQTDSGGHRFDAQDPATVGRFDYGGGHMQVHASQNGLGALDNAGLAAEIQRPLGSDIAFVYTQPQLAGGIATSAADYARLLRKILGGQLVMRSALGTHPVCVDPATCPTAVFTPSPRGEQWHYSVGHWVEDDPTVGDGAFSSPGAFGFYPWIDAGKTWYGVLATLNVGGAIDSVRCGRLIRKAWLTGTTQ